MQVFSGVRGLGGTFFVCMHRHACELKRIGVANIEMRTLVFTVRQNRHLVNGVLVLGPEDPGGVVHAAHRKRG